MGVVYRAHDPQLNRDVALKVIRTETADEQSLQRFRREASAMARLRHPNILSVFDVGEVDGKPYYTMELIDGESLKDVLKTMKSLPPRAALRIMREVALGIQHAHDQGIVHRDIKPENILVTHDGVAKLADLGLAKSTDGADAHLTQTGAVLGTPHYLSPEQALGKPCDIRSDLYSLGGTLYTLLTAKPPYEGPTIASILAKHLQEPVPSIRALRPGCSEGTDLVCRHALAKNADSRYASPEEMIADLDAVLAGHPPPHATAATGSTRPLPTSALAAGAPGATLPAALSPLSRSTPSAASTPTMLAGKGAPASAMLRSGPGTEPAAFPMAAAPPRRRNWTPYALGAGAVLLLLVLLAVATAGRARRRAERDAEQARAAGTGLPAPDTGPVSSPAPPPPPVPPPTERPSSVTPPPPVEGAPAPGTGPNPPRPGPGRFPLSPIRSMGDLRETVEGLMRQRRYDDARAACDAALQRPALSLQRENIERLKSGIDKVEHVSQRALENLRKTEPGTPITANGTSGKFVKAQEGRLTIRGPEGPVTVPLHDLRTDEVVALFRQDPGMPPGKTALAVGALYYAEGQIDKAIEEWERAGRMGETTPEMLGEARRRLGEKK